MNENDCHLYSPKGQSVLATDVVQRLKQKSPAHVARAGLSVDTGSGVGRNR
jgi:hypothetical protein